MRFVAIRSDGAVAASDGGIAGGKSGGLGLWSFPGGDYLRAAAGSPRAISSDFRFLANENGLLDLSSAKPVLQLSTEPGSLGAAAFSPNGEYLAFTDLRSAKATTGRITVIKTAGGSLVSRFGKRYTFALAIHPDNKTLASGNWDNVTLWDIHSGERLALLRGFGRYVYGIGFSKDGQLLAAGTDDGNLQIWDVAKRRLLYALRIGYGDVSNPAFSPDGQLVAAGTYADGNVSLVNVSTGTVLSQIHVSMFGCGSVAFTPDGQYLVTPSNGGQIRSRQFDTGGTVRVFRAAPGVSAGPPRKAAVPQ
jgi:WD40 repeat protein